MLITPPFSKEDRDGFIKAWGAHVDWIDHTSVENGRPEDIYDKDRSLLLRHLAVTHKKE
jgi:hypothetical protein